MDEPLQDFETELKVLVPRSINSQLLDRVRNELMAAPVENSIFKESSSTAASHFNAWRWLGYGATAVAATVAVVITVFHSSRHDEAVPLTASKVMSQKKNPTLIPQAAGSNSGDVYHPVAASNVLYEMKDEGPASDKGDSLERRVRYRYVDTYTWKNPRNNALITWSVPRDEIRVQPAQFN